jgi:ribonucleoside-diphosphate reductase alpha chain
MQISLKKKEYVELSENGRFILKERFLHQNEHGETIETPADLFQRVAHALAKVEQTPYAQKQWEQQFYDVMADLSFHPATRILATAGSSHPQMANCFVFPLADSQEEIFQTLRQSSIIKSHGGGCGFNYSAIRPKGDMVRGLPNLAAGPVKLLKLFNMTTTMFPQQGRYESGNMAVLNVDHPDILDFITAKTADGELSHTNISLGVTNAFMEAASSDKPWNLSNPRTKQIAKTVSARQIWEAVCYNAWETGDPGILFLDQINANNPLQAHFGDIIATNPCGEIGLYPYESCNLGYLNLTKFLLPETDRTHRHIFDEAKLQHVVSIGIRMIDNAITASWFPIPEITKWVKGNRRIGLGVTGWADCLAVSGIAYDSEEALALAEKLAKTMYTAAFQTSLKLGQEKGPFENIDKSIWRNATEQPRNVALLAFPPSGNNAIIFNTSFAIEPFFALAYTETVMGDRQIHRLNHHLHQALAKAGLSSEGIANALAANNGSIQEIDWIPENIKRVFKTNTFAKIA